MFSNSISSNNSNNMYAASKCRRVLSLQMIIAIVIVGLIELPNKVICFNAVTPFIHNSVSENNIIHLSTFTSTRLAAMESMNDDVLRQLAKAKELLELSKAKLAAQEEETDESKVGVEGKTTIVLESSGRDEKRTKVTKSTNDESGLITTDGELMAMLSEEEDWEVRSLLDVFEDELEESDVSKQLRRRDVAASVASMRLRMHGEDYLKIFNTRNRWIGEY